MKQAKYDRFDLGFQYVFDRFSFALTATTNPIQTSEESHLVTSINPIIGMAWEGFKFGYSYDFNLSPCMKRPIKSFPGFLSIFSE